MNLEKYIYLVIILFCVGFPTGVLAQKEKNNVPEYDTNYIESLTDKLAIRIYGINKFYRFDIKDNDLDQTVGYAPNSNLNLGVAVNYRWFGLGLAFNFPFINNDNNIYGKTNRFDIQTNIFTRRLAIDLYLQYYKGFFIENPESYLPTWSAGMPYPQRPDIITTTLGGSCTYRFNSKKFSARAAFIQTELQKKSAGSFLLGGFFYFFNLSGDSAFVPSELRSQYNPDLLFNKLSIGGIGVSFGYTHTFVIWKKLNISFTLAPGVSVQNAEVNYNTGLEPKEGAFITGRFLGRIALAYNTRKSFAGLTLTNDSFSGTTGKEQQSSLNFEVGVVRIFYGRRFNVGK